MRLVEDEKLFRFILRNVIRASLGVTQPEMARDLGVSLRTYKRWELGQAMPTQEPTVDRIEEFFLCVVGKTALEEQNQWSGLQEVCFRFLRKMDIFTLNGALEVCILSNLMRLRFLKEIIAFCVYDRMHGEKIARQVSNKPKALVRTLHKVTDKSIKKWSRGTDKQAVSKFLDLLYSSPFYKSQKESLMAVKKRMLLRAEQSKRLVAEGKALINCLEQEEVKWRHAQKMKRKNS